MLKELEDKLADIYDDEEEIRESFVDAFYSEYRDDDDHMMRFTFIDGEWTWFDMDMTDDECEHLYEMAGYIENSLNNILTELGKPLYDFASLKKLTNAEKLKYFYMFCLGTMKNDRVK